MSKLFTATLSYVLTNFLIPCAADSASVVAVVCLLSSTAFGHPLQQSHKVNNVTMHCEIQ